MTVHLLFIDEACHHLIFMAGLLRPSVRMYVYAGVSVCTVVSLSFTKRRV